VAPPAKTAAIVTVGSELTEGLRVDTNTAEIARDLQRYGFRVSEATSVGDDVSQLADTLARLAAAHALVVTTGGLGPTHDDVTRDAAAQALGVGLSPDESLVAFLEPFLARHRDSDAAEQVLTQALVLAGAEVLLPTNGTAAGQVAATPAGVMVLLPGPPREMRPMLAAWLERFTAVRAAAMDLGVTGMPESDVQLAAQRALSPYPGVGLTVLAKPGDVRVVLLDEGAGERELAVAADAVADEIGDSCYSVSGETLAETVIGVVRAAGVTVACAESCTGGMVCSALTDVEGSSAGLLGGVVAYANAAKVDLLDVPPGLLAQFGAVSEQTARAMAEGARARFGADIAVATTGIAGPDGGTAEKPVGTVWFAVSTAEGTTATLRQMGRADRYAVRSRATAIAMDLIRRAIPGA
jgi:nicotinamide-nucleotide amidase